MTLTSFADLSLDFDPATVFKSLYQPPLSRALGGLRTEIVAAQQCEDVQKQFCLLNSKLLQRQTDAAWVHQENLRRSTRWELLKSNLTCLHCLRRRPEHTLSCAHTVCDTCLRIFGKPTSARGYRFSIRNCILCCSGRIIAGYKPPTAGIRILSIDGGGIRGVVPLAFLDLLQKTVGSQPCLQDLFDLAFGTSSGTATHSFS